MKTILSVFLGLLICTSMNAQDCKNYSFTLGVNVGYSIGKSPETGLDAGVNFKDINFHAGFIAHVSDKFSGGLLSYVKAGHTFNLNSFYAIPSAGYGFVYRSADDKRLNSSNLLLSGEFGHKFEFREQPMAVYVEYVQADNLKICSIGAKTFF